MKTMKTKKNGTKHNKKTRKNTANKKRKYKRKITKKNKRSMKNTSKRGRGDRVGGGCGRPNRITRKKNHMGGSSIMSRIRMRPRMPDISIKGRALTYLFDLHRGYLSHPELNRRNVFTHVIINDNYLKHPFFKGWRAKKYRSVRPGDLVRYIKQETNENLINIEKQVIEVLKHPLYIERVEKGMVNYKENFNNKSESEVVLLGVLLMVWMNHMASKFDESFLKPVNEIEIKPNSLEDFGMYKIKELNNNQIRLMNALISQVVLNYGIGTSSYKASKNICTMNRLKYKQKKAVERSQMDIASRMGEFDYNDE